MSDIHWLTLLKLQVERSSRTKVAQDMDVSRAAISTLLSGKYPGDTARMAARIVARYGDGTIHCPHLNAPLLVSDCKHWRTRFQPTSDPRALKHWVACRKCPVGDALTAPPRQPKESKDAG